ncbi:MAG: hypothetical protein KC486_21990 [Myxococcales bacterium]|nr:hypothetical protein [Myxococcales bacterium]
MSATLRAALLSAAAVAVVELALAAGGWVVHPTLGHLAWLSLPVVLIAAAAGVRASAAEGRDYAGQLVAGAEIGLVAGIAAAVLTWTIHRAIAPAALEEARALAEAQALARGGGPEAVADAVGLASPFGRAILRFIEVMFASVLAGLVVARRPRSTGPEGQV